MPSQKSKIKFFTLNNNTDPLLPQFSLTFKPVNKSYDILSSLKGNYDLVIEFDSEKFIGTKQNDTELIFKILDQIKEKELIHTYRKSTVPVRTNFLSQFFMKNKTTDAHVILTYVPDNIWSAELFKKISEKNAARYYIIEKSSEHSDDRKEILSKIIEMPENERKSYCKLIAFVAPQFCQIGIVSDYLKASDIKQLLGIQ